MRAHCRRDKENAIELELAWMGRVFHVAYKRARRAGEVDPAVSHAVLTVKTLQNSPRSMNEEAVRYVLEQTGFSFKNGTLILDRLR